jgi:hypothetical protein
MLYNMHAITEAEIKSSPPMKAALVDFYESYLVEPNPVVWIWMLMNTRDYPTLLLVTNSRKGRQHLYCF